MQKIFVVEDDENIRNLVKVALEGFGYQVICFENAENALDLIEEENPEMAIFDLMLPGMDGLEAISKIRNEFTSNIPLIILTAKDKEYDKVVGLDGGADDYITKPFGVLELAARVRSLLRRVEEKIETPIYDTGKVILNLDTREVFVEGVKVALTYKEFELLAYLIKNCERVVPREELLDRLWDYNVEIETRTLDIHIRTLRGKLGKKVGNYIDTIRSVGYRFVVKKNE